MNFQIQKIAGMLTGVEPAVASAGFLAVEKSGIPVRVEIYLFSGLGVFHRDSIEVKVIRHRILFTELLQGHLALLPVGRWYRISEQKSNLAEAGGFEPPVPFGTLAFQASALDHYATPPNGHRIQYFSRYFNIFDRSAMICYYTKYTGGVVVMEQAVRDLMIAVAGVGVGVCILGVILMVSSSAISAQLKRIADALEKQNENTKQ